MSMPRITANLPSDESLKQAKLAAVNADKPLAHWAGDAVVREINRLKEEAVMTPRGRKTRTNSSTAPVKRGAPKSQKP